MLYNGERPDQAIDLSPVGSGVNFSRDSRGGLPVCGPYPPWARALGLLSPSLPLLL
ncbi:MAG: hypothetical protein IVW55_07650 [Chloroflexi bacterium]|nr:hypothetical protein [Chloroflexota bacterium]